MDEEVKENNTLVRYFATILVGDKYHKKGEEFTVGAWELEHVKKNGLRLEVKNDDDVILYHFYPVAIRKVTYQLTIVCVDTVEGGDRKKEGEWGQLIGSDIFEKHPYDWRDHWP